MPSPDPNRTSDVPAQPLDHEPFATTDLSHVHTSLDRDATRAPHAYQSQGSSGSTDGPAGAVAPAIPGYAIESVLGRGGMGVVYKAHDLALKRTVALKMVLAGGHAGPRELARFRIEAEAVARLQHPNIVQIHEVGEAGGYPYCALEFVEGGDLASKLGGKPIPIREAAKLVESLARAMQLAHSRNVVHRDLKPANILLTADGTPKITDFGLARQMDSDSGETQAGAVMGTPSYMAPEQASGQAHEAGPAADVYALGAILYDCLTGRPPFQGKSIVETLDQVRTQEPVPPSRWQLGVPLDLDTICMKCLRKEPEKRYASAAELADELVRYQQAKPILARPVGRVERAVKWIRRNPVMSGAAAVVVLALVAGTTVSALKYLEAEEQRKDAETQKGIAEKQKGIAQGKEQEAKDEADRARKEAEKADRAAEYLVSIFKLADGRGRRSMTPRQILDTAEKEIPEKFADQPELRDKLLKQIGTVYDQMTADAPLAMILEARGTVQLHLSRDAARRAVPQTLLYTSDRLSLGADGHVRMVVLSDLHQEWLRAGVEVTVQRKGCQPVAAVDRRASDILMTFVPMKKGTTYLGWNGNPGTAKKTVIAADFEIAAHDVTQGQWEAVMGTNPSHFSRIGSGRVAIQDISDEELKLLPVESVSWGDCQEFLKKLNENERGSGWVYRLPTEAEWEYACRGGATSEEECLYHFYFDKPTNDLSSLSANFNGSPFGEGARGPYLRRPTRVGAYPSNKLGLCDMHGNVWQWCADPFDPKYSGGRVLRGGAWLDDGFYCRAASRRGLVLSIRRNDLGFRLVRVPSALVDK